MYEKGLETPRNSHLRCKRSTGRLPITLLRRLRPKFSKFIFIKSSCTCPNKHGCQENASIRSFSSSPHGRPHGVCRLCQLTPLEYQAKVYLDSVEASCRPPRFQLCLPSSLFHSCRSGTLAIRSCRVCSGFHRYVRVVFFSGASSLIAWCRRIRECVVSSGWCNFVYPHFGGRSNQDCVLTHAQSCERNSPFVSAVILCTDSSS